MVLKLDSIKVDSEQEALLLIRRRCKLNQFQFAEALGISQRLIWLIENNEQKISDKTRQKIHVFLKNKYPLYVED